MDSCQNPDTEDPFSKILRETQTAATNIKWAELSDATSKEVESEIQRQPKLFAPGPICDECGDREEIVKCVFRDQNLCLECHESQPHDWVPLSSFVEPPATLPHINPRHI